jgi:lipoprotein-releasing system ATP-binding protein
MSSSNILTIKNLEKIYETDSEKLTVLKGLNLNVEEGAKIAVVGESGSGKSTLLNIIAGIDNASSGSVTAGNSKTGEWNVTSLSEAKMAEYRSNFIGLIFQFHYLLKDFTALENVYMPALISGMSKKEAMERAAGLLDDVGVADRAGHLPSQLSGGERQRVAAARALINDPTLILADEPTGNLDPANAQKIGDLLFSMADKYKKTLILVTHDMNLAAKGDRQLRIVEGRLK